MSSLTSESSQATLFDSARLRPLDAFFSPQSIAVVGATDRNGHFGRAVLWNLISNAADRTIYPVNPRKRALFGIATHPSVKAIPVSVDLCIVMTPAETVPDIVQECGEAGVKAMVVLSAGFRETGPHGVELEQRALARAHAAGMRLIGPNCMGVMCPGTGLNATCAPRMASPGRVALITQSGAMGAAILEWSLRENVGLSALVSVGSMLDVGWGDLIDYLGDDPRTQSIVVYMESIGNAQSFLSAAREVALNKPIIAIKAGRTQAAAKAASAHTGALIGSDEVVDAAFRRVGVLRVNTMADVFFMTEVLAQQPRPKGPRLAIVTNAGGPGVIATDALLGSGGELAPISEKTTAVLNACLPPHWSHGNPVDILGDADPDRYEHAVEAVAHDPNVDGVLVIMTPQGMTNPPALAEKLKKFAKLPGKPILASWMGGLEAIEGEAVLNRAGIPTFPFPDTAVGAFQYMWRYSYNLRGIYETPTLTRTKGHASGRDAATRFIEQIRIQQRTTLSEFESKSVLKLYGIPVVDTHPAMSEDEAVERAEEIGYPVALKVNSYTLTHKAREGGVHLSLPNAESVRKAWQTVEAAFSNSPDVRFAGVTVQPMVLSHGYELIVGSTIDPQFGPVILFGAGGRLADVFNDKAIALPPLNSTLARRMMEQTKIFKALTGSGGRKPVDIGRLEQLLVTFSDLVAEQPWIKEMDVNPLLVWPEGVIALDARIILHDSNTDPSQLPKPAIRPYPDRYIKQITAADGTTLTIRPIRPEDEPLMVKFHYGLSERSVYLRYFNSQNVEQRTSHERLIRSCFVDYNRQIAFVAESENPNNGERQIIGVAKLVREPRGNSAELAATVMDAFQGREIGHALVMQLVDFAKEEKIDEIIAMVLMENRAMQNVLKRAGFTFSESGEINVLQAKIDLARTVVSD